MAKKLIDRRVARTRELLHEALLSLMANKNYDAITVEEICATANVGRSTFYSHFMDKDAPQKSGLERLRGLLSEHTYKSESPSDREHLPFAFGLTMLEHARSHRHLHGALAGSRGGAIALNSIANILRDLVRKEIAVGKGRETEIPRELIVEFVVGGYMAVASWWLDKNAKFSAQQIDRLVRKVMLDGIANYCKHEGSC